MRLLRWSYIIGLHAFLGLLVWKTDFIELAQRRLGQWRPVEMGRDWDDAVGVQRRIDGQVQPGAVLYFGDSLIQGLPHIREGKLKALAVLGETRSPLLPDVPTVGETVPGFSLTNWFAMVAPVATPSDIVAKIATDARAVIKQGDTRAKLAAMAADAVGNSPEEFGKVLRDDSEKWGRVVKEANIRAD